MDDNWPGEGKNVDECSVIARWSEEDEAWTELDESTFHMKPWESWLGESESGIGKWP